MMTWFKNFALPDHWISAVLTVMTLSLLSGYGLASTRPVIHVTFEFELLPPYDDQIGPERRTKLSTCIVNRFIAKAERKWGFVQWSSSASSEKSPSWQLKLKLDGPRLASGRGWVTSLIQSRSLTGRNFEPFELLEYQDVYALNNQDFSYHDWKTLERDISDQLDKQLQGLLKDDQVKDFMGKIPIAHKVIAEKENQGLVIPFRFKDLRASNKTSLRITFINPENGKQGTIDLVPRRVREWRATDAGIHNWTRYPF